MEVEINGEFKEDIDSIEHHDVERAVIHRGDDEIEIHHLEEGIQVFQNLEKDLKTSRD